MKSTTLWLILLLVAGASSTAVAPALAKILMRAMFGQEWWLTPRDFTSTNFHALAERGVSFPIVIDDISRSRLSRFFRRLLR